MVLTVKLFATFRQGRFDVARIEHPANAPLERLVEALGIPRQEVGILLVGGRHAELEDLPPADATVAIFPLVGGG